MGISRKLQQIIIAITLVVGLSLGVLNVFVHKASIKSSLNQKLDLVDGRLSLGLVQAVYAFDTEAIKGLVNAELRDPEIKSILVWSAGRRHLLYGATVRDGEILPLKEDFKESEYRREGFIHVEEGQPRRDVKIGEFVVILSKEKAQSDMWHNLGFDLLMQVLWVFLLVITMGYVINKYMVRPIEKICGAMETTRNVAFDKQQDVSSGSVGTLSESDWIQGNPVKANLPAFSELRDMGDGLYGMIMAIRDGQNELKNREEYMRIMLESMADAIIATNENGRITRINTVAADIVGWQAVNAIGEPIEHVVTLLDGESGVALVNPALEALREGHSVSSARRTVLSDRNGEKRVISYSASPISAQGKVLGSVIIFRDISEQSKLEEQLRQSQKMDSIGQLAGGVAHDFNNMLGGILGSADLLAMKLDGREDIKKLVDMIIATSERAADLTAKLLTFSRKAAGVFKPLDVNTVLGEAKEILERSIDKRIEIRCDLLSKHASIVGDIAQLQNAIINLGVNARDAMPDGGILTLRTEDVELDEVYCRESNFDLSPGPHVQVSVVDTGVGMPPDVREKIFEPFFTTKEVGKGTGLGLAAVYGTLVEHGGGISVYSEEGRGTAFHCFLPCADVTVHAGHGSTEVVSGSGGILVVDDEQIIRSTAEAMLTDLGYKVFLANDGEHALRVYEQQKDAIDLVILDMVMPKMNGEDCFVEMKRQDPDIRIIMSSGFTREASISDLKTQGLIDFVKKPYRRADLSRAVAAALQHG